MTKVYAEFSCLEQYKLLIKDSNYNNLNHYKSYILPLLLQNHPIILKDIKEKNVSPLPKSFCKILLKHYATTIRLGESSLNPQQTLGD